MRPTTSESSPTTSNVPTDTYSKIQNLHRFLTSGDLYDEEGKRCVNLLYNPSTTSPSSTDISNGRLEAFPMTRANQEDSRYANRSIHTEYGYRNNPDQPRSYALGHFPPQHQHTPYNQSRLATDISTRDGVSNRSLLGTLNSGASRLKNMEGVTGIYFTFPDLSVRGEGTFRLQFKLFDVKHTDDIYAPPGPENTDKGAPCLARVYTAPFTVFSAKRFPGVWTSTDLSKCFAEQGVKLPVRKDLKKPANGQAEYDDEDEDYGS